MEDVKRTPNYGQNIPFKINVSELLAKAEEQSESKNEYDEYGEGDIEAIALVCWNCRKAGHRYQDCQSERKVFCYGCGMANTYKPSCSRC